MGVIYFDPTSTSGPDGYINYKMSGGGSGGSAAIAVVVVGFGYG